MQTGRPTAKLSSWSDIVNLETSILESPTSGNITAARMQNLRTKVVWSETVIADYQTLITSKPLYLQNLWLSSPTRTCLSLFIRSTNDILTSTASQTNKTIDLSLNFSQKSAAIPKQIRQSQKKLLSCPRNLCIAHASSVSNDTLNDLNLL